MKNLFLFTVIIIISTFASCKKETSEKYKESKAKVLTIETPAGSYEHAYTMKGESTFKTDNGQNIETYAVSQLFTKKVFNVGDDLTSKLSKADSIYFLHSVRQ